ncbi:phospho-N-acetylmuramoyl-pentapeptide-transferase [Thermoflexus sp.]|uniref:phospho-N-acetylmuramoyl-pentapeptide- transferase n=1 Tax=Thermoflexus sp. TaxID=1969742 RepID=UPI002ADE8D3A|nr:phospho-N-acetylmuramoyl-pentapeptide-transferase [Thermoflexus sp.]
MAQALFMGGLSFLLAVVWGPPLIRWLRANGIGKKIRIEGPRTHLVKMGTPTMGGLMIVVPVVVLTLILNIGNLIANTEVGRVFLRQMGWPGDQLIGRSILVPVAAMLAFGALGAVDDWMGVRGNGGLLARHKFPIQIALGAALALVLHFGMGLRSVAIPTVPQKIDIGLFYLPIAVFIIVGSANAVNFTDGLDGLAGIITATSFIAYGVIAYLQGQIYLATFAFIVVGSCLAFLWFNAHPAQLIMGDIGSQALGATLGVVALMTGQWLLLPIVALIPVVETLSVILQVAYFKWTRGKRLFRMSPIHHHFELLGWSETQVVQRFWLIAIWSAMIGVALALL